MDDTIEILQFEISRNRSKALLFKAKGLERCSDGAKRAAEAIEKALESYRREHEQQTEGKKGRD